MIAAIVLHFLWPVAIVVHYPYTLAGIPVLILGLMLNGQANTIMKEYHTTLLPYKKPSRLIEEGPFRHSRNPIYLGSYLIFLGIALLLGSVVALLGPIILFVTLDVVFIRQEEKTLEATFGQAYLDYKRRVRRWL